MVTDPGEYNWSSYKTDALGQASDLCTPHHGYLALGADPEERKRTIAPCLLSALIESCCRKFELIQIRD